ncbi:MAG: DUF938 domain-containing protein [Pseudomonadota bacterium]
MTGKLPPSASVANPAGGAKLHAPAADRNAAALTDLIAEHAPARGCALEIASGTGQHIAHFARRLPGLSWHPTDVEAARLRSIDAYAAEAKLTNIAPAAHLDAAVSGWSARLGSFELIVIVNLLHLIPTQAVRRVLVESALALAPGGVLILYGPFARDGTLTSAGDVRFDAELRAVDAAIGYKDTTKITASLQDAGLHVEMSEMPANNLSFIARKSAQ